MSKYPVAVLLSDVHYSVANLALADTATAMAIQLSNKLNIQFIVAGDLHDTKANLRGECVNAMIKTFSEAKIPPIILRGNHDSIHEKSQEHSLGFLALMGCDVIHNVAVRNGMYFIAYHHSPQDLEKALAMIPKGSTIIMHQGIKDANAGDYLQDKSAIDKKHLASFRVVSGHYHTRQSIKLDAGGRFDYIGNPYTVTFGEANDPDKGFQVLYNDGTLEFIPTYLRRHVKLDMSLNKETSYDIPKPTDLVWVKLTGNREDLAVINKKDFCIKMSLPASTRLELCPIDTKIEVISKKDTDIDDIIHNLPGTSNDQKDRLKTLWKALCE